MKYILEQQDFEGWILNVVGGKGYALSSIRRAGVPVPDFFCVTTDAYKKFISQPVAQAAIQVALTEIQTGLTAAKLEHVAGDLGKSLATVPIPRDVEEAARQAHAKLSESVRHGHYSVAVRSSATAEDLLEASFAGQHDSFLSVRGVAEVLNSVRQCWISLWSPRAIAYRERLQIEHERVFMAVIIQRMINADVSGVLFTINPITGANNEIAVNAIWGIGEMLVSGQTTPDEWVVDKQTNKIIKETISDKVMMATEREGMITKHPVPDAKRARATLSKAQLIEIAEAGGKLEEHFSQPQDIEWAFGEGHLFILQSRPVTSISRRDDLIPDVEQFRVDHGFWTRIGFDEWLLQPLSPLFETLVMPSLNDASDSLIKKRMGLKRAAPTWRTINGYFYVRANVVPTFGLLLIPIRFWRNIQSVVEAWSNHIVPKHVRRIDRLRNISLKEATESQLLRHLQDVVNATAHCWAWIVLTGFYAKLAEWVFGKVYTRVIRKTETPYAELLVGFPNKSVEADQALWELAEKARSNEAISSLIIENFPSSALELLSKSEEARDWYKQFHVWLDAYGHRVFDLDILQATSIDHPEVPLSIIQNYLINPVDSPASRQQGKARKRKTLEESFHKELDGRLTRDFYRGLLRIAQRYVAIREDRPFYLHLGWPLMRRDVLELGKRLVKCKSLQHPDDIFFLNADELRSLVVDAETEAAPLIEASRIHSVIKTRRELWERQKKLIFPEHVNPTLFTRFILSKLSRKTQYTSAETCEIVGNPGSAGKATGKVCVVKSPKDFEKFAQGAILVAPYTTPAWTPLLSLAAGVITETGGPLSHAAIVAREYGIPAVVGVPDLLNRVSDGDQVEIDGDRGCVNLS